MRKTNLTKAALAYVGAASLVFSTLVAGTAGAYATDPVTTGAIEATTSVEAHHSISGFVFQQQGGDLLQAPNPEKATAFPCLVSVSMRSGQKRTALPLRFIRQPRGLTVLSRLL